MDSGPLTSGRRMQPGTEPLRTPCGQEMSLCSVSTYDRHILWLFIISIGPCRIRACIKIPRTAFLIWTWRGRGGNLLNRRTICWLEQGIAGESGKVSTLVKSLTSFACPLCWWSLSPRYCICQADDAGCDVGFGGEQLAECPLAWETSPHEACQPSHVSDDKLRQPPRCRLGAAHREALDRLLFPAGPMCITICSR